MSSMKKSKKFKVGDLVEINLYLKNWPEWFTWEERQTHKDHSSFCEENASDNDFFIVVKVTSRGTNIFYTCVGQNTLEYFVCFPEELKSV